MCMSRDLTPIIGSFFRDSARVATHTASMISDAACELTRQMKCMSSHEMVFARSCSSASEYPPTIALHNSQHSLALCPDRSSDVWNIHTDVKVIPIPVEFGTQVGQRVEILYGVHLIFCNNWHICQHLLDFSGLQRSLEDVGGCGCSDKHSACNSALMRTSVTTTGNSWDALAQVVIRNLPVS